MATGTILAWLKVRGDTVREGEPLLEVETDKVTVVAEATMSGTHAQILVPKGHEAALGGRDRNHRDDGWLPRIHISRMSR
jgi:pyruvate/2-oxoglutarate dehydrogenase complex dihydrolipoamide acyltransferase (E2) component